MPPTVFVYADESCLGNQFMDRDSAGGGGGLVQLWRDGEWARRDYWISEPATTNNRMALRSAIEPLRALKTPCDVIFTSDSQYLVRGMNEWVAGWIRRGWKRKEGEIGNVDLWRELVQEVARHRVQWQWVRGHAGHPQNEYANVLAIRSAREQSSSDGFVESGFCEWLEAERIKGRYLAFQEFLPPVA
jgi:ribonuclease HI